MRPRLVLYGWILAAVAAGCSSDDGATTAPTEGQAGVAGQPTAASGAGSGGAAGVAGATAAGASGGAAGSGVPIAGRAAAGAPGTSIAGASGSGAQAGAGGVAGAAGTSAAGGGAGAASSAGTAGNAGASGSAGMTAGNCEFPEPPDAYAAWVDQSWNAQLGDNIESRKAWILDNVVLNKGAMNLCVRWGATSPASAEVRMNLASTVERWFNDWLTGLGGYGCFPYGQGIKVKVTGWAVRPGRESLIEGLDPSISVYTETDPEGEPKCPDACSSFEHWNHEFPDCKAGADMHHDYWIWLDDTLSSQPGAAAVGGDWGLRMPLDTFVSALSKPSDHIIEHEMGHGFGIQDYYDWTGAKPEGGSIMIVGSTQSEAPTMADHWLLRRTWREMKELRGW